jgi:DNA replicative helicase MCM subunit Mcm2 (Cdc46/Mcm family)
VEKRKEQCDASKEGESYTTTRSLLALIRLCQARVIFNLNKAKLRFSNEVSPEDIQECI